MRWLISIGGWGERGGGERRGGGEGGGCFGPVWLCLGFLLQLFYCVRELSEGRGEV